MAELGVGYISIVPEVSKISPGIAKALKGADVEAAKTGQSMGAKLSDKLQGTLKKGAMGAGVAAGGFLAAGITKGIGRLNSIEQAEAKLKGLGNSTKQVGSIMENALASVNGTAFGLEEAASSAAGLVAAGIKPGKQLETTLKTVADTATIAGASMQDMGTIFGSVAARGKLQGDDMLQLLSRGVPVLQLLAEETGKTSAEISDMVSKGEIDFATFEAAMRRGMGGAALEAGNTAQGAFRNMWAAAGRFGATLAGPFYKQSVGAFKGVTDALDNMNATAKPIMEQFAAWLTSTAVPAFKSFANQIGVAFDRFKNSSAVQAAIGATVNAFENLMGVGKALGPALGSIAGSLAEAGAALGVSAWSIFASTLSTVASVVRLLEAPLNAVATLMENHPTLVLAAVAAWARFNTLPGVLGKVQTALSPMTENVSSAKDAFKTMAEEASRFSKAHPEVSKLGVATKVLADNVPAIKAMGQAYADGAAKLTPYITRSQEAAAAAKVTAAETKNMAVYFDAVGTQIGRGFTAKLGTAASVMSGTFNVAAVGAKNALGGLKSAGSNLVNMFGGPLGATLTGAAVAIGAQKSATEGTKQAHDRMAESVRDGAAAQKELQAELAGTNGELGEQGLAAAARIAKGELASFITEGSRPLGIDEKINQATVAVDGFLNKIPGMGNEASRAAESTTRANKSVRESYEALETACDDLGIPMGKINDIVAKGGPEYEKLIGHLNGSGEAGQRAAAELEGARSKIEGLVAASRNVDEGFAQAAAAVDVLAESSSAAEDKLGALESLMQALGLAPKNAEQAMMDAADAIDEIAASAGQGIDSAAGLGDAMFNLDGKLDPANTNARELSSSLSDLRGELQNVAVNGGDTKATFEQMQPALKALQEQFGLTDAQMEKLVQSYGLVPDQIDTLVNLEGASEATQEMVAVAAAISDVPAGKPVEVKLEDQQAIMRLQAFGAKVETLPNGNSKVTFEDQAAVDRYNWWMTAGFPHLDMQNPTASINLDDSGLLYKTEYAKMQLATLDLQRPTPLANMDVSQLSAKQVEALQKVGLLDGQKPTPDANLDISELSQEQQLALAKVFDLDSKKPTPVGDLNNKALNDRTAQSKQNLEDLHRKKTEPRVTVDNRQALAGINDVKSWLSGIKDKVVNIFTRRHSDGNADGGVVGLATGGMFGSARGYRLPMNGRGTHEVDGFQGVDGHGRPTARVDRGEWVINRRSSQKHHALLQAINDDAPSVQGLVASTQALANGGIVRSAEEIKKAVKYMDGTPYVMGGWSPRAVDCSGAVSLVVNDAVGLDHFDSRMSTVTEGSWLAAKGFERGKGGDGDIRVGWYDYGGGSRGHTAMQLQDGTYIESGGNTGGGFTIGRGAGPLEGRGFTDFMHLKGGVNIETYDVDGEYDWGNTKDAKAMGGEDDPNYPYSTSTTPDYATTASTTATPPERKLEGATSWSDVAGITASAFAKGQVQDILGVFGIPDSPPALQAYSQYKAAVKQHEEQKKAEAEFKSNTNTENTSTTRAEDLVEETPTSRTTPVPEPLPEEAKPTNDITIKYDPSKGVDQWKSTVEAGLTRTGHALDNTARTLEQIQIESGGDPNARNDWDINAKNGDPSIGLLQVIGSTFRAYRDKGLPNDQTHPLANIVAALNYVKTRYGGPAQIWPTRAGYRDGGLVRGPGGKRGDKIPAWLSDAEFVVNAAATAKNLPLLGMMNQGAAVDQMIGLAVDSAKHLATAAVETGEFSIGLLQDFLVDQREGGIMGTPPTSGGVSSSSGGGGGGGTTINNFYGANSEEMYRMYRKEAARTSGGKVGAR